MKSLKSYLFTAFYSFLDNNMLEPQIFITNRDAKCKIPINLGTTEILLNLKSESISKLLIDDEGISFMTRFLGVNTSIFIPLDNILYIQSKDKEHMFPVSIEYEDNQIENIESKLKMNEPVSFLVPVVKKPELKLISSSGLSDGIPTGKLTLVK